MDLDIVQDQTMPLLTRISCSKPLRVPDIVAQLSPTTHEGAGPAVQARWSSEARSFFSHLLGPYHYLQFDESSSSVHEQGTATRGRRLQDAAVASLANQDSSSDTFGYTGGDCEEIDVDGVVFIVGCWLWQGNCVDKPEDKYAMLDFDPAWQSTTVKG